jgi:hypothetical protein
LTWPSFARSTTEWSSSWFSRRSTAHTCHPGASEATKRARGRKYAALADVPGLSTSTFSAFFGPTLSTPTRSSSDGVWGASNPAIRAKRVPAVALDAPIANTRAIAVATSPRRSFPC